MSFNRTFFAVLKNRTFVILMIAILCILLLLVIIIRGIGDPSFYGKLQKDRFLLPMIAFILIISITIFIIPSFLNRVEFKTVPERSFDRELFEQLQHLHIENSMQKPDSPYDLLLNQLRPLESDIREHISKLQRNSIVNLVIGIIGTIMSSGILSITILSDHVYTDMQQFALNFLPRLSFVIFIQLFAFFFLRLYKSNLEDSKYFQNELTNIIAKTTSIKIAFHQEDNNLVSELIRDLSKIERNFKLLAGETLLNIEKAKIDRDVDVETLSVVKDFFKNIKSKSEDK